MRQWLLMLALACPMLAEDIYISQVSSGADTGASCADAHSASWFNAAGNWGVGVNKLGAGDTAHVCGTITTQLTVNGGGSDGSYFTILFEGGAKLSSPAWSGPKTSATAGALVLGSYSYIIVDGGQNGLIENTDNGTLLGNQVDSVGVNATSASYVTVRNLAISHLYVREKGGEQNAFGVGVSNTAKANSAYSNFTVTNCVIHDAYIGVDLDYPVAGASDIEISHNDIYNVNWGGRIGDRADGSTASRVSFHHNSVHDFANWDDTSLNSFHHNGFFGWAVQVGGNSLLSEVDVYSNTIGPNFTTPNEGANNATSGVYFEGYIDQIRVYNNLFLESVGDYPADGLIYLLPRKDFGHIAEVSAYNNTFVGDGSGIAIHMSVEGTGGGTQTFRAKNNLINGVATAISIFNNATITADVNNNLAYGLNTNLQYSYSSTGSSIPKTFAQWQALGFDAQGLDADPHLSDTHTLVAGSPAIGAGANLTSLGIAALNSDKAGVSRHALAPWDIGAYQYLPGYSQRITGGRITGGKQ